MLVLSRKPGEKIRVGPDVKITVIRCGPNSVRIGIDAPKDTDIVREELLPAEPRSEPSGVPASGV